ncbi:hypothetical protein FHW96_000206 [Novosphingobium sp. SG751A]|uniref:hypothetical protein n=1 Tax=Novosphingobium sp. SG751A TaxID=2587000 RepID=UPI001556FBFD|nr:hypothetical protein [Novosphingobium sp. SG751A]NOW44079.1 hypothetical protein [Novosphingobium sp. SG751A]
MVDTTQTAPADLVEAVREVLNHAYYLLDDTANDNPPEVSQESWDNLSKAVETLEGLIPQEEQPCIIGVAARLIAGSAPYPAHADLVERIARDQAKADQLNWDEPCLQDADNDIYCESSTCMAAFYEDHDADAVRQHYLSRAKTAFATVQAYMASDGVTQMDRDLFAHILLSMNGNEWVSEGELRDAPDSHPAFPHIIAHRQATAITALPNIEGPAPLPVSFSEMAEHFQETGALEAVGVIDPRDAQKYLVWSNEHAAWWGKDRRGYTRIIANAGRYSRDEALKIAGTRDGGWHVRKDNPDEIAIPEQDAIDQYAEITRAQEGQA